MREMSHQQQQPQIHQLQYHLQQQHIQPHQQRPQKQQQPQQEIQPHSQLQQMQQQPVQTLPQHMHNWPASSSSSSSLLLSQQLQQIQTTSHLPQAIYYTQHYYPTTSTSLSHNSNNYTTNHFEQHSPSLKSNYLANSANNLYQPTPSLDPPVPQSAFDPYFTSSAIPSATALTTLTSAQQTAIVSLPQTSCNIYHHNNLNNNTNINQHYKPRNSAVYRHQTFKPFYATIQRNSNDYHPNQQRLQQAALMSTTATTTTTTTTTLTATTCTNVQGPKLIWLLFMHRHGDRTPLNMAPRDKYNNVMYWPEGFGNLDNAGRQRMYKLGKFIRRRYEHFLTDNIREIYSRSSDVDRCIESSHATLAGLYPPSDRFEWNKELRWVPAPVHTVPAPEDYLLNEAGRKFLAEVINEVRLIQNSGAVEKLYQDSARERELLERELGYEYEMFWKFKITYSTLDIEERNGLTMPAWYTPELKEKLYRFAGIAFGLAGGGTEKLKKLRCGHLLNDIVSRMDMAPIDGPKLREQSDYVMPTDAPAGVDDRRIVHYSTHDSILAAFLEALNINTPMPIPPGFGATFFVELYVDLDEQGLPVSEKYIKLFYMDDTDSEKPIEKKLPNCKLNEKGQLTLNNFKAYVGHLLSGDIFCNL